MSNTKYKLFVSTTMILSSTMPFSTMAKQGAFDTNVRYYYDVSDASLNKFYPTIEKAIKKIDSNYKFEKHNFKIIAQRPGDLHYKIGGPNLEEKAYDLTKNTPKNPWHQLDGADGKQEEEDNDVLHAFFKLLQQNLPFKELAKLNEKEVTEVIRATTKNIYNFAKID